VGFRAAVEKDMNVRILVLGTAALLALGTTVSAETPDQAYQRQLDNYHRQQQEYLYQRDRYEDRLNQYEYDRVHPDWWWRSAYFHAAPEWYIDVHDRSVIGTEVDERDGRRVGRIGNLDRASDGRIERVEIVLTHNRAAWVDASDIRYDGADRIAFVDLGPDALYARSRDRSYDYRP
jgi:hypothetical protein